jgi:hypothetical protein
MTPLRGTILVRGVRTTPLIRTEPNGKLVRSNSSAVLEGVPLASKGETFSEHFS